MPDFTPSQPEKEQIELALPDAKLVVKNFTEYSFNSHFMTPTDGWSFTVAAENLSDELKHALFPGAKVQLTINGGAESTGYIDHIDVTASRQQGTQWHISGRDVLAQVVDANADPTQSLKENQTLEDALISLFSPFGWTSDQDFIINNDADRNVKAQGVRGEKMKSQAKGHGRRALRDYQLHQLKPYPREGVYAFASRIAERFGLKIWATASGRQIVISKPDFDTDPFYALRRTRDGTTNVLGGNIRVDTSDQPTIIVADSYTGGGANFGRGPVKVIMINTAVFTEDPAFLDVFKKYPDAHQIYGQAFQFPLKMPRNRVLYLHDEDSQTLEQLTNFVRREMAHLQMKGLALNYVVEGHGQMAPDGFHPWTVDTTVHVKDDLIGVDDVFYVLSRTFNKSRGGGTTTHLELIRRHTIELGDAPSPIENHQQFQEKAKRDWADRPTLVYQVNEARAANGTLQGDL